MSQYFSRHKWHLIIFFVLLLMVGMSWKYMEHGTWNINKITNPKLQIPNNVQNLNVTNTTKQQVTGYRLQDTGYTLQVTSTSTALEAMKNSQLNFKTKTFAGLGEFVEEIGGLKNDNQNGKYWGYFINGQSAKLGISTQIVVPGDLIEWKYE